MRAARFAAACCLCLAAGGAAFAQTSVAMSGRLGERKALLVIDGVPHAVTVGGTARGVRLLSVGADESVVEYGGKRLRLLLGSAAVNAGPAVEADGKRIVIPVGSGGHFATLGAINGRSVEFVVDTGATAIAMSESQAERIGLAYRHGPVVSGSTANGMVTMHVVRLRSVRIGDVQVNDVEAAVVPAPMPHVLLGNTFLGRFQMKRDSDVLTLTLRY